MILYLFVNTCSRNYSEFVYFPNLWVYFGCGVLGDAGLRAGVALTWLG